MGERNKRDRTAPSDPSLWPLGTSLRLKAGAVPSMSLEALRDAGVRCAELAWRSDELDMLDAGVRRACERLARRARAFGIDVQSLHLPYGEAWDVSATDARRRGDATSRHRTLLGFASRLGVRTAVLHPSWEPIPPGEREARLDACRLSLAELADESSRLGVRLAVECLPRTCLGNGSGEMRRLIEADERLGVCVDVNHLLREPPEAFIRELGGRIVTVHLSDNDGTDERHWLPGAGVIRWNEVLAALAGAGYRGPFLFEARPVTPEQLATCHAALLEAYATFAGGGGQ